MPGSNAGRIDLIGNSNYLKVIGDSVSVSLPYFGERQMGGGYNSSGQGIEFNGIPQKYDTNWNAKKERYEIEMTLKQKTETFQFNIIVFPSLTTEINVSSTHRFSIRYSGAGHPMEDK
jgi:hypothetical protein